MTQREIDHTADIGKKAEQTAESAPNVSNGDLIYRKAAIDADALQCKVDDIELGYYEVLGVTEDTIDSAPTVIEVDRIESAIRHIQTSTDVEPWAMEIAVKAMQKQIDHIAESGKKVKQTFCSNCRNEAPEGKINSDCLMCMHLYGVHTQEANKEAAYESINFPKRDLFEPKKG